MHKVVSKDFDEEKPKRVPTKDPNYEYNIRHQLTRRNSNNIAYKGFNFTGIKGPFTLSYIIIYNNTLGQCLNGTDGGRPYRTAILVPYRDRGDQLGPFLRHMHAFLQKQCLLYQIYFVSQVFYLASFS